MSHDGRPVLICGGDEYRCVSRALYFVLDCIRVDAGILGALSSGGYNNHDPSRCYGKEESERLQIKHQHGSIDKHTVLSIE
jgi:hypothetical protein